MSRFRQKGSRNWARGILATFWILLAGVSGLYLFSTLSDPSLGGQLVKFAPASGEMTSAVPGSRDRELAEIKAGLRELTQQLALLSARLEPEQKNAALSPQNGEPADTETPPAASDAEAPEVAAAPPASTPAAPPPAEAKPKPAEAPPPEAKPVEQAAVEPQQPPQDAAPKPYEPPPVAVSPLEPPEEEATTTEAPALSSPGDATEDTEETAETPAPAPAPAASASAPTPPAETESAALDPINLPPAANDGSTRYGIEIGTVSKQDALRPLWREFLTNHAALVAGLQPRRVLAPDKKWRLIAGPFSSAAEATQACALFKKASRPCEATVYAGDAL
jgi:hypothetical protein